MTKPEFAKIIAYLGIACGKELSDAAMDVYYDLLGDLSADALKAAAKYVALRHIWATFPTPAELRIAANATAAGIRDDIARRMADANRHLELLGAP